MPNLILDLVVDRVDLVDEGANSAAHIKLYKRKETEQVMLFDEILAKMKPEHAAAITAEITKAKDMAAASAKEKAETDAKEKSESKTKEDKEKMDGLEFDLKKAKEALKEIEVAKSKPAEPDFEEVLKSLDPAVQEVFKSMKSQKDAAEQVARDAAEKTTTDEAISKAKELKALPIEEAKLVEVMKGISPEIHEILKAANQAIIDGGLFEEVGKGKSATTVAGSADEAWAKIEKAAEKIEAEEKVTKAKSIAKAVKENPDLYREYLKGGAN
jgi:hypothetical protein